MNGSKDARVDRLLMVASGALFALCAWTFQGLAVEVRDMGKELNAIGQRVASVEAKVAAVEAKVSRLQ